MSFNKILGHTVQIELLRRNIANGQVPPTYLFHGDEGIGKLLVAVEFAKAVNCERPTPDGSCDSCQSCRNIEAGCHPNITIMGLELNEKTDKMRTEIVIDQVHRSQHVQGDWEQSGRKVVIVDGAHLLNESAANAFLKTLEEPPDNTHFILITSKPARLLQTILSRCRSISFQPLREADLAQLLMTEKGMTLEQAGLVARLTDGRVGEALATDPVELVVRREEFLRMLAYIADSGPGGVLKLAEEIYKKEGAFEDFVFFGSAWFRDLLIIIVGADASLTYNKDIGELLGYWAGRVDAHGCEAALAIIREAGGALERPFNRRLLAEDLFFRIREEALG